MLSHLQLHRQELIVYSNEGEAQVRWFVLVNVDILTMKLITCVYHKFITISVIMISSRPFSLYPEQSMQLILPASGGQWITFLLLKIGG